MSGIFTGILVGFIVQSIAYLLVSRYELSVHREALEKEYDNSTPESRDGPARTEYIEMGLREYRQSLSRKLLVLIYIIPMIAVAVTAYVVNLQ